MNQQEIDQWLGANGGASLKHSPRAGSKKIPNPNYGKPGHLLEPETIEVPLQAWTNPATGATLKVYQLPGDDSFQIDEQVEANPQARTSASANETVSAPPTQPNLVSRRPDGSLQVDPNPNAAANTPAGERAAQEQVERQRNSEAMGIPFTDVEKAEWLANREKEQKAATDKEKTEARQAQLDAENKAQQVWSRGIQERQVSIQEKNANKPDIIDLGQGRKGKVNEDGTITDVTPTRGGRALPQVDGGAVLGELGTKFAATLEKIEAMDLTPQEKLDMADRVKSTFELIAQETTAVLSSQQNTLTNQTSQRNTDVQDAASRRSFAANLQQNSFQNVAELAQYAPAGSKAPGMAFMEQLQLGMQLAERMGGLKTYDRIQPGAAAQQVYNTPLPGSQPQQQPQQAQPQAAAGQPITFNINAAPTAPVPVPAAFASGMPSGPASWNSAPAPIEQPPEESLQPGFMSGWS